MPINYPQDPQAAQSHLSIDFSQLASESPTRWFRRALSQTPTLDQSRAHRVYTVGLDDLASGKLLSAVHAVAWRYFLMSPDNKAMGEVEFESDDPVHPNMNVVRKVRGINKGPFAQATAMALQAAGTLEEVRQHPFEPRFLKIAGVYFAGLWLHGEGRDIIIPIGKTPGDLHPNRPYSQDQIIAVLQPIARRNKAFHDTLHAR